MKKAIFVIISLVFVLKINAQETVTISGRVTDFENRAIDSCAILILDVWLSTVYKTYSDQDGYYSLEVEEGNYKAMYAIRPKEHLNANSVPEEDMRMKFWAWNIIADRNLTINPRYQKLELYATTVYEDYTGVAEEMYIFFRPKSLAKSLAFRKEAYSDKSKLERDADLSVSPEYMEVEVYADNELLKVNNIQRVSNSSAYVITVDRPKVKSNKPYVAFKIIVTNKEHDEIGENIFFYELLNIKEASKKIAD